MDTLAIFSHTLRDWCFVINTAQLFCLNDRIWDPINSPQCQSVILALTDSAAFGKQWAKPNIVLLNSTFHSFLYNARQNFPPQDIREWLGVALTTTYSIWSVFWMQMRSRQSWNFFSEKLTLWTRYPFRVFLTVNKGERCLEVKTNRLFCWICMCVCWSVPPSVRWFLRISSEIDLVRSRLSFRTEGWDQ